MLAFDELEADVQAELRMALLAALKWAWHRKEKSRFVKAQPTSMTWKVLEVADKLPGLSAGAPAAALETIDALLNMRTAGTQRTFHVLLSRLDQFVQPQLERAKTAVSMASLADGLDAERQERMCETAAIREELEEIGREVRGRAYAPRVGAPSSGGHSPPRAAVVGTPVHAPQVALSTDVFVVNSPSTPTSVNASAATAFGNKCFEPFSPAVRLFEKAERFYRAVAPSRAVHAYELWNNSHLLFLLQCMPSALTLIFSVGRVLTTMAILLPALIYVSVVSVLSFRAVSDGLAVALHQ